MTGTRRMMVLSAQWHSLEDQKYYMSYVKGFLSSEPEQVQAYHSTIKNVIEWGLGKRHSKLGDVLQQLSSYAAVDGEADRHHCQA